MITAGAAANVVGNSFLGNSVGGYGNFGGASESCCACCRAYRLPCMTVLGVDDT